MDCSFDDAHGTDIGLHAAPPSVSATPVDRPIQGWFRPPMAMFRIVGDHVVGEREFEARGTELRDYFKARGENRSADLELSNARRLTADSPVVSPGPVPFTPIGYGSPLTILIRDVYTGKFPHWAFLGGGDVAVVSALKNYDVFAAGARALNFVQKAVKPKTHLTTPAANADGCKLVAYSPAVMTESLSVSFEFAVDEFNEEFTTMLSGAFSALAGIPILLPYAGYLLCAGEVLKLAGDAGHALFDGVKFEVTSSVDFKIPGVAPATADFRILCHFDASAYRYRDGVGLVDAGGTPYSGDEPYIVISLDGAPNDDLKKFAPTVTSAGVLQRFFQVQNGGQAAVDALVHGLQLASDFKYRELAVMLDKKLAQTQPTDPARADLKAKLDAALKNISSDALRPAQGAGT
jgi:hypothetical protein